ncbi:MAG: LamG domain-containing protein, partial [Planctomycetes bacterium]|nr:LamG domain-containing protein [Planctomycetota bacterium]
GNQLDFNGSTIAHTFSNNEQIAVVVKSGEKPRFFVDGEYIGEGTTVETPDDSDATVLNIGNNNAKNSPTAYAIKQVYIFNKALTG